MFEPSNIGMPSTISKNTNKNKIINSTINNGGANMHQQHPGAKPVPTSKLHQYFASSEYIAQQDQLCVFINDFPVINLDAVKSINEILPMLIKQNQLLARKTQQQVKLMKQSYLKHQQLSKQTRDSKRQMEDLKQLYDKKLKELQFKQLTISKKSQQLAKKIIYINKVIESQNFIIQQFTQFQYKSCEEFINQRQTRLAFQDYQGQASSLRQLIEQIQHIGQKTNGETQSLPLATASHFILQENYGNKQMPLINLSTVEKYCKIMKKRNKHIEKIRPSVEDFCHRLNRILEVVPADVLAKEFKYQTDQFVNVIRDLVSDGLFAIKQHPVIKAKVESGSRSKSNSKPKQNSGKKILPKMASESSLKGVQRKTAETSHQRETFTSISKSRGRVGENHTQQLNGNHQFFEDLLTNLSQQNQQNQNKVIFNLQNTISELQKQLAQTKAYYEAYLINIKLEFQTEKRENNQELTVRTQTNKHYEEAIQKYVAQSEELKNKIEIYSRNIEQQKQKSIPLEKQLSRLKQALQQADQEKKSQKNKFKCRIEQVEQLNQIRFKHANEVLEKQKAARLSQQAEHEQSLQKQKKKFADLQNKLEQVQKQHRQSKKCIEQKQDTIEMLEKKVQTIEQQKVRSLLLQLEQIEKQHKKQKEQGKKMQKVNSQLSQQAKLRQTYIAQLQSKLSKRDESIKALNSKVSSDNISKKQANQKKKLSNSLSKAEKECYELDKLLKKEKDENSKLKYMIKDMKKQLQQVYLTLNQLKEIQCDRQKLIIDAQKSERWKEKIMRDYDEMKYEILKAEAENKHLSLEVKHYKSALNRIQLIK